MNLKLLLIITVCLITSSVYGQAFQEWKHSIGYFGNNLINPGIEYSIETPLYDSGNQLAFLLPSGSTKVGLSGHLISYWDPFSHVGLLNYYELNGRQFISKRLGIHLGLGLGSQYNFTTDNYKIDDDFNVSKNALNADVYVIPEISLGIVYKNKNLSRQYLSKINMFFLTPYNNGVLPSFSYSLTLQL